MLKNLKNNLTFGPLRGIHAPMTGNFNLRLLLDALLLRGAAARF